MSTDLSAPSKPAARLWKHRPFLHYFASRSLSEFSYQIAAVAVGWQIYALTHTIYVALAVLGVANAFDSPASATLLPAVTSEEQLQRGTALSTGAWQLAAITGPAAGGLLYAIAPTAPYLVMSALSLSSAVLIGTMKTRVRSQTKEPPTLATLLAGVIFVRRNPAILGTISLDLFAVLLGGATASRPPSWAPCRQWWSAVSARWRWLCCG